MGLAPRPTDTVLVLRPVAMTSSMALRRRSRAMTSNMGRHLATTNGMILRRSRAITSNMGHRLAMIGSTARPRDTMTGTEQRA